MFLGCFRERMTDWSKCWNVRCRSYACVVDRTARTRGAVVSDHVPLQPLSVDESGRDDHEEETISKKSRRMMHM